MKRKWAMRVGILAIVLGVIPFPYPVVPAWQVRLTYSDGTPAAKTLVHQQWADYSADMFRGDSMGDLITDSDGIVSFPARWNYAPQLLRAMLNVMSYIDFWSHASYGRHSQLWIDGGYYPVLYYEPAQELKHEWMIHPESELGPIREAQYPLGLPSTK